MASVRSRALRLAMSTSAVSTILAATSFVVSRIWTRHVAFEPFPFQNSHIAQHPGLQTLRLEKKSTFSDGFVREVPIEDINPDLLQDVLSGGTKLIEHFAAGVYGRYGMSSISSTRQSTDFKTNASNPT